MRHRGFAARVWILASCAALGCATTSGSAVDTADTAHAGDAAQRPGDEAGAAESAGNVEPGQVDTRPREAATVVPAPRRPVAEHEACGARAELVRAAPLLFEGAPVQGLWELELEVTGPTGLSASLEAPHMPVSAAPSFDGVALPPEVTLRLPPGPAVDEPAGPSGNLYSLTTGALIGSLNAVIFPFVLPVGLLTNQLENMFIPFPTYSDGMFSDSILDEPTWKAEVARRAAPHAEPLANEAARQERFQRWRDGLALQSQSLSCSADEGGRCTLRALWPAEVTAVRFARLPCADPPAGAQEPTSGPPDAAPKAAPKAAPPLPTFRMPRGPAPRRPALLALPPRPDDDARGRGAEETRARWRAVRPWPLEDDQAEALWKRTSPRRTGEVGVALRDGTLVCALRSRGNDFDADGSAPEMRARIAFGWGDDVVGQTYPEGPGSRRRTLALERVTLLPGELVKISVVDADFFVDDWVGMDLVTFDGTWPLRFDHPAFAAECRALPAEAAAAVR